MMIVRQLKYLKRFWRDREVVSGTGVAALTFGALVAVVALVVDMLRPVMYVVARAMDIAQVGVLALSGGLIVAGILLLRRGHGGRRGVEA